jgi:hypothetical protein
MASNGFADVRFLGFIRSGDDEMKSGFIYLYRHGTQSGYRGHRSSLASIALGNTDGCKVRIEREETYKLTQRLRHIAACYCQQIQASAG